MTHILSTYVHLCIICTCSSTYMFSVYLCAHDTWHVFQIELQRRSGGQDMQSDGVPNFMTTYYVTVCVTMVLK